MEEIICYCKNIYAREIEEAVVNGAKTLSDIKEITGACTGNRCKETNPKGRCCSGDILKIINTQVNNEPEKCKCCED